MDKHFARILTVLTLIAFGFIPSYSFAYQESPVASNRLRASVSPANPEAGDKTIIRLSSFLLNLDACPITWRRDGNITAQGTGQKAFSFQAPQVGKSIKITVMVECQKEETIQKNFIFETNDVDLLISPETYTPPFYKGNSRPTAESIIRIVAFPQISSAKGNFLRNDELVFRWTKDGKAMPLSSGTGKNSVAIKGANIFGNNNITLEISDLAGEVKVVKTLNIPMENPMVLLYENRPLLGNQYQKSLSGSFNLADTEISILAEPYFFPYADVSKNGLSYSWYMNGRQIEASQTDRNLILRQDNGSSGEATIAALAKDLISPLLSAQNSFRLNFGKNNNIFGL